MPVNPNNNRIDYIEFPAIDVAKTTAARSQIEMFMTALGSYKLDTSTYPTTEQGLNALRIKPEDVHTPGVYVQRVVDVGPDVEKRIERRTTRPRQEA